MLDWSNCKRKNFQLLLFLFFSAPFSSAPQVLLVRYKAQLVIKCRRKFLRYGCRVFDIVRLNKIEKVWPEIGFNVIKCLRLCLSL